MQLTQMENRVALATYGEKNVLNLNKIQRSSSIPQTMVGSYLNNGVMFLI